MTRLAERCDRDDVPFTMLMARRSTIDLAMIANDQAQYDPKTQITVYTGGNDPLTMGRSTCFRRQSTGLVFLDDDRQQDD